MYMTSYSRLNKNRPWEKNFKERPWLYQTPMDILIKASNGASDFGNKFGQPLICGSVLTFEHCEDSIRLGFEWLRSPETYSVALAVVIVGGVGSDLGGGDGVNGDLVAAGAPPNPTPPSLERFARLDLALVQ